ncbi:MAG: MMPL family transporter [Clostridia bacterium]
MNKKTVAKEVIVRIVVGVVLLLLCVGSVFGILNTRINYTLIDYLPEDSATLKGFNMVNKEFGSTSYARVMIKDININAARTVKESFSKIEGIKYSLWIDDMVKMALDALETQIDENKDVIDQIISVLPQGTKEKLEELIKKIKDDTDMASTLDFLEQNPILLDAVDLITNYYFDGAISLTNYYNVLDKNALIEVYFTENDYSMLTNTAIDQIKMKCSGLDVAYEGTAISTKAARETTSSEVLIVTVLVVPLAIGILMLTTNAYIEPLLLLLTIAMSVLFNMGTNLFLDLFGWLDGISFITNSMATALQMAITMDYAIFVLHKYRNARTNGLEKKDALKACMRESILPTASSCLTTVAGFVAMTFMDFGIGKDIGFVFAKGVIISFIVSLLCMPFFLKIFDKLLTKTEHKPLMPTGKKLTKFCIKFAIPIILVVVLLAGGSFMLQDNLQFMYGESAISASVGTQTYEDSKTITEAFGLYNPIVIMIPKSYRDPPDSEGKLNEKDREMKLIDELRNLTVQTKNNKKRMVASIMSYRSICKPGMESMIPAQLVANFDSENYTRIVINLNASSESPDAFAAYDELKTILTRNAVTEWYVVGSTVAASEMRTMLEGNKDVLLGERDYTFVNLLGIAAIFLIIMFTFKSISVPILLVSTIEMGIFINMAISALQGTKIAFLGYLIVSLIQLGATIDYAILYMQNYVDSRKIHDRNIATLEATRLSITSVLTSALILCVAGFSIGFASSVQGVSEIGFMIGRGALISGVLVLVFLPPLVRLFDRYIPMLSLKMKFLKPLKVSEEEASIRAIDKHIINNPVKKYEDTTPQPNQDMLEGEVTTTLVDKHTKKKLKYKALKEELQDQDLVKQEAVDVEEKIQDEKDVDREEKIQDEKDKDDASDK